MIISVVFFAGYIYAGSMFIPPHFHANFALYANGERFDFSWDEYMEDVSACTLSEKLYPEDRAHLHENNPDTIHVHDEWVSWGHFFANINVAFWDDFITLDNWELQEWELTFILNWETVLNPYNELINSKDRLLIAYNTDNPEELFETVSSNAGEYNAKYDPGSCGGTNENWILAVLRTFVHKLHSGWTHE